MSKKYRKKTTRSRRKQSQLRGKILGVDEASVQLSLPVADVIAGVQHEVEALAAQAGLLMMKALLEDEVAQLTGPRYAHDERRQANRWGQEDGYAVFAGRKVPLRRPRVRSAAGREVPLERYRLFQGQGSLQEAVARRVIHGVSTRGYEGVLDAMCDGYGIRKSSVSRQWKAASTKQLATLMERRLNDLDLVAILLDGIEFQDYLLIVGLGIDSAGRKHVLGLWQGATENTEVCLGLLADLIERGLPTDRQYLFILDGSKALRKAVRKTFGEQAAVQRCQVHKERNVLSHLPPKHHARVRQRLRAAWKMKSYQDAKDALNKLVEFLAELNPSAARSLQEGLEETLTLHRLGVPERLRRTLRSTNPIESCFARTRELCRNVKRWKNADMAWRWAGTMLIEAQKGFKRIRGYRELPLLTASLTQGSPAVDAEEDAA